LRIQGDVVLKVTFTAAGQVVVQSVISGLGHGLDEEARRVAQQIRFRPATKNGQAVDSTTTIRSRSSWRSSIEACGQYHEAFILFARCSMSKTFRAKRETRNQPAKQTETTFKPGALHDVSEDRPHLPHHYRFYVACAYAKKEPKYEAVHPLTPEQSALVDKAISQEKVLIKAIRKRTPLVETYIQNTKPDVKLYMVPVDDQYMLSRVDFAKGFVDKSFTDRP
jgi:TonB family protein